MDISETGQDKGLALLKIIIPVLILAMGGAGAWYLLHSKPKASRQKPPKMTALVQIQPVEATMETVSVRAMGTVIPAREVTLRAQVGGEIVEVSPAFQPGATVKAGSEIMRINPVDYELAFTQKQAEVAQKAYELKLEMGHQRIASREWKLISGSKKATPLEEELALRRPHLENAKAALEAAKSELEKAKLDLERTRIHAPFNAVIQVRKADLGTSISSQSELATLAGTDEYWVQVSVPTDRLEWIAIPGVNSDTGSTVRICPKSGDCGAEATRTGTVIRLLSDLEDQGRMARLLVSVNDPLDLENPGSERHPLLIGSYVRVDIEGRSLENVFRIPRYALREDASVWIAGRDDMLEIRDVSVVWRDEDSVLVRQGLKNGDEIIVSDLGTPVKGMPLQVANREPDAADGIAEKIADPPEKKKNNG